MAVYSFWKSRHDEQQLKKQQEALAESMVIVETEPEEGSVSYDVQQEEPVIVPEYQELYEQNQDFIGWLRIEGTNINYPVMQTPQDEEYYLYRDFYGEENQNGCLIMDTDSNVGVGDRKHEYQNGSVPSTNLIIHGHTMKSGEMFGDLDLYADETYGLEHSIICYDSLYEHREYELIAVFYSQVFYENQDVFKYYKFFQADTGEEFDDWYDNIKQLSLYDTGVTAEFGDEFITLSCCAYHVEDGRFVVVARRIRD
ncbi:MAG: class B sortase [Lachnospiraceae bacterium]|nr:class B sortase [Lachnospiraceae bacterium]